MWSLDFVTYFTRINYQITHILSILPLNKVFIPRRSILYRTDRYCRNIPYRPVNQYRYLLCFVPEKISTVPATYRSYRWNLAISAGKWIPGRKFQQSLLLQKPIDLWHWDNDEVPAETTAASWPHSVNLHLSFLLFFLSSPLLLRLTPAFSSPKHFASQCIWLLNAFSKHVAVVKVKLRL